MASYINLYLHNFIQVLCYEQGLIYRETKQYPVEAENCITTKVSPHCLLLARERETLWGKYLKHSTNHKENELPAIVSSPSVK
jgi:hypothetical protein